MTNQFDIKYFHMHVNLLIFLAYLSVSGHQGSAACKSFNSPMVPILLALALNKAPKSHFSFDHDFLA